ncbi:MAG: flagellar export chaperone FliS [Candidatus Omnitrophica bacterium]|nr:flagellar export chaperone FliS [Candidatus Omnitrophota bacterium]
MSGVKHDVRQKYLLQEIENASAIGRVIMLIDACNRFLSEAKDALKKKDRVIFNERIIRAKNIIRELRNALNLDLDPAMGGNLYRLYTYFLKQLIEANRSRTDAPIDYVINQMTTLNNAWKQAERQGLGKEVKRYEERMGTNDVNIIRRVTPTMQQKVAMSQKSGNSLLETLNVRA